MKVFLSLLKVNLNLNFGISALKYRFTKEKKKRWEPILVFVAIILGFGPLIFAYSFMLNAVFKTSMSIGQPELILTMGMLFAQLIVLVFGIFYVLNAFYFSKDLNILIPMPLSPYQVLGSKFAVVTINEYLTILPILLPPVIIYGIGTNQGLIYWIKSLLTVMAIPVIPLVLSSIFIVILMRVVNIRKSKDLLTVIGGILAVFLGMTFNLFMQKFSGNMVGGNEQEFLNNLLTNQFGLIKAIGNKFPPSIWATLGVALPGLAGLGYLLLFLGISALMFMLLLWIGNKVFYKGVLSGQEVTRSRKTAKSFKSTTRKERKAKDPVLAMFWKEWKILFRTPVYVLNGLVGTIIAPFLLLFIVIVQGSGEDMKQLFSLLKDPDFAIYLSLGGLAFMLLTAGMNIVPSTAISREGSTFWISKLIPVKPSHQVMGKFFQGLSLAAIGVLLVGIMMVAILGYSVPMMIVLVVLGILGSVPMTAINLLIDIARPKLAWNSPQEAMKQNLNGALGMLSSFLIIALLAGIVTAILNFGLPTWFIYLALGISMILLSIPSMALLFNVAEKRYINIEM